MQTVAIILAGGLGKRLGADIPKQFIEVEGKPIIVSTIENFERSTLANSILIVCVADWIDYLQSLIAKYHLDKVRWIIEGGQTNHDSTSNAIFYLRNQLTDDDFIIVHDAARPLLPQCILSDLMRVAVAHGNASASLPCHETLVVTADQASGTEQIDRSIIRRVQTPQAYRFGDIYPIYVQAAKEDRHDFVYINTAAISYGMRIYFSAGFDNNIKITTKEDIALFQALSKFNEDELVK
ncbi:MAG: 2-C-methyl-D-erythritol 4-phosphate cytidylyltransferase [Bacilli bacterium]|nr:2-C-methyl-D-erythritol 4-phosphate cytidylyltransferase [Bacilli bacterium]